MSSVQRKLDKEMYKLWYDENYEEMKKVVSSFLEGRTVPLDKNRIKSVDPLPEWVDRDKIKKGQELANDYLFVVTLSELISVYLLLLVDNILRPLIYTNKSSTVKTAFKRYFSTILRVLSWYDTDILDEDSVGRNNIISVNQLHLSVLTQMMSETEEEIRNKTQLKNRLEEEMYAPGCPFIRNDLVDLTKRESMDVKDAMDSPNYINQYSMALTQYAFMGLVVLYPEKQGMNVSRDRLESFIHLWRYIGYLLGIEDKYNVCVGSYEEVTFKCQAFTELIFKPNLALVTPEWEHMSHAVCVGVDTVLDQLVFESTVILLLELYDLNTNEYWKSLSWGATYKYYYYRVITYLLPYKFVRGLFNKFIKSKISLVKKLYLK